VVTFATSIAYKRLAQPSSTLSDFEDAFSEVYIRQSQTRTPSLIERHEHGCSPHDALRCGGDIFDLPGQGLSPAAASVLTIYLLGSSIVSALLSV
jgi:hypothetical protein